MNWEKLFNLWLLLMAIMLGFVATVGVLFLVVAVVVTVFELFFGTSILGEMVR